MSDYICTKRLKTVDGVIHEIGERVTLTGDEEESAVRQQAVVAAQPTPTAQRAPTPSLPELQQEAAQLQAQIATMEHEGGAPS